MLTTDLSFVRLTSTIRASIFVVHKIPKASVKQVHRSMCERKVRSLDIRLVCAMCDHIGRLRVLVVSEPIKFVVRPQSTYNIDERARLVLPCIAFGSPQPAITWFKVRRTTATSVRRRNMSNVLVVSFRIRRY
jgi:hypothetical protein